MKNSIQLTLALVTALILSACGDLKETRVTESSQPAETTVMGSTPSESSATIVHVNRTDRLATLRNGHIFGDNDFLIATNRSGEQTGTLKVRPQRPIGLRTADVLEGSPNVNDAVAPASASEAARLADIYRAPEE